MDNQVNMPSRQCFIELAVLNAAQTAMPTWVKYDGAPKTLRYLLDVVTMTDDSWFRELVQDKFYEAINYHVKMTGELRI